MSNVKHNQIQFCWHRCCCRYNVTAVVVDITFWGEESGNAIWTHPICKVGKKFVKLTLSASKWPYDLPYSGLFHKGFLMIHPYKIRGVGGNLTIKGSNTLVTLYHLLVLGIKHRVHISWNRYWKRFRPFLRSSQGGTSHLWARGPTIKCSKSLFTWYQFLVLGTKTPG